MYVFKAAFFCQCGALTRNAPEFTDNLERKKLQGSKNYH
jgi:hypothetical protein